MRPGCASFVSKLLDGRALAKTLRSEMSAELAQRRLEHNLRPPALAMVVVGDRPDSLAYIRMKNGACNEVGILSETTRLSVDTSESDLLATVETLNQREDIDGILVQFPLPLHIDPNSVIESVSPLKDVDGLHPINFGKLFLKGCVPLFAPCTPLGCMALLHHSHIPIEGQRAVILGRSNIVGSPMAALLQRANATVSICHSKSREVQEHTKYADIVISAVGHPKLWTRDFFKPGATVIDVGSNSVPNQQGGNMVVGDVDFEDVVERVGRITPVPGGVGPMTITMLLANTLQSWRNRFNL